MWQYYPLSRLLLKTLESLLPHLFLYHLFKPSVDVVYPTFRIYPKSNQFSPLPPWYKPLFSHLDCSRRLLTVSSDPILTWLQSVTAQLPESLYTIGQIGALLCSKFSNGFSVYLEVVQTCQGPLIPNLMGRWPALWLHPPPSLCSSHTDLLSLWLPSTLGFSLCCCWSVCLDLSQGVCRTPTSLPSGLCSDVTSSEILDHRAGHWSSSLSIPSSCLISLHSSYHFLTLCVFVFSVYVYLYF